MQPFVSTQPSVDDLLGRLHEEQAQLSALRAGIVHGVPRPPWLIQLLLAASVLMIAAFTVGIGSLGLLAVKLTAQIREHRAAASAALHALPTGESLRNPQVFAEALQRQPLAAARLHAARGIALVPAGEPQTALAAFAEARDRAVIAPAPAMQLAELQALLALKRIPEARSRLLGCDLSQWPPAERAAAVSLWPQILESTLSH